MVNIEKILKHLNEALSMEYACIIRYSTHATVLRGPYADTVGARLTELAEDEKKHADKLRDIIDYYSGDPTMDVSMESLKAGKTLEDILDINIEAEKKAIKMYQQILKLCNQVETTWLYETVEDLLEEEEKHLYELQTLRGK